MAGELRQRYRGWVDVLATAARDVLGHALVGVVLYGSVARQSPHDGSDVDLLLIVEPLPSGRAARRALADHIEQAALRRSPDLPEASLVLRTPHEIQAGFPLLLDIVAGGTIVMDTAGAVAALLAAWSQRLAAVGARRIVTGESWHWDLAGGRWREGWRL
jgi:predicted nucleotidyltransferase